jgi:hypothetical protein
VDLIIGSYLFDQFDYPVVIGNDNGHTITTFFYYDS